MTPRVCVALHDVSPDTWDDCHRWLDEADALGVRPLTLLLVPDFHARGTFAQAPAIVRALGQRSAGGDEFAQHGLRHRDEGPALRSPADWLRRRVLTAGEGEFAALDQETAAQRLDEGRQLLTAAGLAVTGFVAPAWLASPGTRVALRSRDYAWTSDHAALYDLVGGNRLSAPVLTASPRSAWRRAASRAWLAAMLRATRKLPVVRVGLHPADLSHDGLRHAWREVLRALVAERQCVTKQAALALHAGSLREARA